MLLINWSNAFRDLLSFVFVIYMFLSFLDNK
jgi:hypothetical protein